MNALRMACVLLVLCFAWGCGKEESTGSVADTGTQAMAAPPGATAPQTLDETAPAAAATEAAPAAADEGPAPNAEVAVKKLPTVKIDCGNEVEMVLALIPAGKFSMGSPGDEPGRTNEEGPRRKVTLTRDYYIGVYEVTYEQYMAVMGTSISHNKVEAAPVDSVNWFDAKSFCKKLSEKTGKTFRLPTEAEWEYACRAGADTAYYWGAASRDAAYYTWYKTNSGDKSHPAGQKKPNAWGLYDMAGNVWEWCEDGWLAGGYKMDAVVDPTGPASTLKIKRGGAYNNEATDLRSARRRAEDYTIRLYDGGFRAVMEKE